jgi:methyl coenzyme M reductase subunit D
MTPKRQRPKAVQGETLEMQSPCGKIYVTLNDNPDTGTSLRCLSGSGNQVPAEVWSPMP